MGQKPGFRAVILTSIFLLFGNTAFSADIKVERGKGVTERSRSAYKPLGIKIGSFILAPSYESKFEYNDNIFWNNAVKRDDFIFYQKPSLNIHSNWNRHAIDLSARGVIANHATHTSENWQDFFIDLSVRLDVLRNSYATAKFYHSRQHEDRGTPEGFGGKEPVEFDKTGGIFGYEHKTHRIRMNVSNETYHLDYVNGTSLLGTKIPNSLRNRYKNETTARIGYEITPNYEAFIEGKYNFIDYDSRFDRTGLERSSTGFEVIGGITLDLTGKLVGDAYIGYIEQDYDDPMLSTISDITGGLGFKWMPTGLTTINTHIDRKILETTQIGLSGLLSTQFQVSVDHELLRNLLINAKAGYTLNEYQGSGVPGLPTREEDIYNAGISAKYLFNRNLYIIFDYNFNTRDTNIPLTDYDIHSISLNIGAQL